MRNGHVRSVVWSWVAILGSPQRSRGLQNRGQILGRPGRRPSARLALHLISCVLLVSAPSVAQVLAQFEGDPFGSPKLSSGLVTWSAAPDLRAILTVIGPDGLSVRKEFARGEEPWLDLADLGDDIADGEVSYSLRVVRDVDLASRRVQVEAGERLESAVEDAKRENEKASKAQTGGWLIVGEAFVSIGAGQSAAPESEVSVDPGASELHTKTQALVLTGEDLRIEHTDIDVILVDTDSVQGQGSWSINVDEAGPNDFALQSDQNGVNGGIQAIYPFVIKNSSDSNADDALVIHHNGDIGFGTAAPTGALHVADSYPEIVMEDTTDGNLWGLRGDQIAFSVYDGPNSVLWLSNDAPHNSFHMNAEGHITLGSHSPSAPLHIAGSQGEAQLLVEEQNSDAAVEVMFNLVCDCAPAFRMQNTVNGRTWFFRHLSGGNFSFDDPNSAGQEMILTSAGNLTLKGSLSQGSSRSLKENLEPANGARVLDALEELDLYEWSYLDEGARHFGPMAEEFSAAYGLGESKAKIAPADMAGIALASAKALRAENVELKRQLALILEQLAELRNQQ